MARKRWVDGELAALRVPDLGTLVVPDVAPTLRLVAARWQQSRVDVRESTKIQHRTALGRVLPVLGGRPVDRIASADVAELVARMHGDGKAPRVDPEECDGARDGARLCGRIAELGS